MALDYSNAFDNRATSIPNFLSKFLIIKAFWQSGMGWIPIPFLLFVFIITFGMSNAVFKMAFGNEPKSLLQKNKLDFYAYFPQLVLLSILFIIGIIMPQQLLAFLSNVAEFFHKRSFY